MGQPGPPPSKKKLTEGVAAGPPRKKDRKEGESQATPGKKGRTKKGKGEPERPQKERKEETGAARTTP